MSDKTLLKSLFTLFFLLVSTNIPATDSPAVGTLQSDGATAHTLSIILPVKAGDDNRNSRVQVHYRRSGQTAFQQSLDMFRNKDDAAPYAGMIPGLRPDTSYDVRITAIDADGIQGAAQQIIKLRTRAIPPVVTRGNRISVANTRALHSALRAAKAGDIILLGPGTYQGPFKMENRNGTIKSSIVIRGAANFASNIEGGLQISNCNYIHVEGLLVQHAVKGIEIRDWTDSNGTVGNVIRGNHIKNVDLGIVAKPNGRTGGHRNLYIVDNHLEGNNVFGDTSRDTWNDEGIVVGGQNIEVAYNTISGFGDSLGMTRSDSPPNRSIDIHHNYVRWGGDDGVEMDFSDRNTQAHHNLLTNIHDGISFQMVYNGPAYAYRNVIYNTEFNAGPYKIKPEAECNDGVFIYNNTALNANRGWTNYSGCGSDISIVNNLFTGDGAMRQTILAGSSHWNNLSWDYNAYANDGSIEIGNLSYHNFAGWKNAPLGNHDVLLEPEKVFATMSLLHPQKGLGIYRDAAGKDFSLAAKSSAIDAGKDIPGITDGFTGSAPDIGACEQGRAAAHYGVRNTAAVPAGSGKTMQAIPVQGKNDA